MIKAVINQEGLVINRIVVEKVTDWQPPEGCYLLTEQQSTRANPGDTWDGSKIIPQVHLEVSKPRNLEAEIDELKTRLDDLEVVKI